MEQIIESEMDVWTHVHALSITTVEEQIESLIEYLMDKRRSDLIRDKLLRR